MPKANPDQYLQKIGNTYYARVRVPRTLEKVVGQSHLRRSLKTGSRPEANLLKHAAVGQMKTELARLRKSPSVALDKGISFEQARMLREQLMAAEKQEDEIQYLATQDAAVEIAEQIERLYGTDKSKRWYRAATITTDTLRLWQCCSVGQRS
jgi:hypothetical protein